MSFVTAFDGSRDFYEVPLALSERGLLSTHVSDMYVPDPLARPLRTLPSKIANRYRDGLSSRRVSISHKALLLHLARRLGLERSDPRSYYLQICEHLSLRAASAAERTDSDLFLYSEFAAWAFARHPERKRILFQFHPHFSSIRDILSADFAKHPEVRWSFENEEDSRSDQPTERTDEWRLASQVVCASTFTKSSLVAQGCSAASIVVTPYGADRLGPTPARVSRSAKCRFLFVGQGVQRKGLHHLLRAWRVAASDDSELVVVSRRVDPGIGQLLDQPGVTFMPGVTDAALPSLYQSADVFVMPSLVEGFGLVYTEALNAGLFTIGTTNTGLPDLKLTDEAATIVDAGQFDALVAALADARERWRRGDIDRASIQRQMRAHTWRGFRKGIVDATLVAP